MAGVVIPGMPHRVTQRGNRREQTFFDNGDYAEHDVSGAIGESRRSRAETPETRPETQIPQPVKISIVSPESSCPPNLNSLAVYLYHRKGNEFHDKARELGSNVAGGPFKSPVAPLRMKLFEAIKEAYEGLQKKWYQDKRCFSLEFLLCFLGVLEDLAVEHFGERLWASGDGRLQNFIRVILVDLGRDLNVQPGFKWTTGDYSVQVCTDFEVLCNHGLVDHIHTPVSGPEGGGAWMGGRIDRRLSTFGLRYYEKYAKSGYPNTVLRGKIRRRFEAAKDVVSNLLDLERELQSVSLHEEKREGIYSQMRRVRAQLKTEYPFAVLSKTRT